MSQLVAAQAPKASVPKPCGTPSVQEILAAHPEMRARRAAIEAQAQRYIEHLNPVDQAAPIGPPPPLVVIPVVVHVIYSAANQNLSDAIVKDQIDILNQAYRGQLSPGPNGAAVPAAFASRVGDVRVQFCLATRDPNGNPTTGITRRDNTGTQYGMLDIDQVKQASTGGTNAWNTAYYLNIWCCDLFGYYGYGIFPGLATYPGEDGIAMSYKAFGRGHAALDAGYTLGRVAVHEVGHWLNARYIWGDDGSGCNGSDTVSDTPNQDGPNAGNPVFPHVTCTNGPNGDMFMNHMDYVDDDSKLIFTAGQALRMQAVIGAGGYRESLKNSPGLTPVLGITSNGTIPTTVFCGDRTGLRLRAGSGSVGCGGGTLQYQWSATNGWTIDNPAAYAPLFTPTGSNGSTITLTGTYTNLNGVSFTLSPVSVSIGYNAAAGTPAFTSGPARLCSGNSYTAAVTAVGGATSYRWTVPAGFTPTGQVNTTAPSLTVSVNTGLAGGFYSVGCQALSGSCAVSALASVPLTVNGGPTLKIVDSDPTQRTTQGVVCQRNYLFLELVPVSPPPPGALNVLVTGINWATNQSTPPSPFAVTPFPMQIRYSTVDIPSTNFVVSATYNDGCGNITRSAFPYNAMTAPAGSASLSNGYSCTPYRWRPAAPAPTDPYPNPAANSLQLPGYQGAVTVYNQQGKLMHTLLAPGTATGTAVDTHSWPAGLYVVTGRNLRGTFERHTVQIQH
jgi:hypothetical protein